MITVVLREGGQREYANADRVEATEHYVTLEEPEPRWGRRPVAIFAREVLSHVLLTYPPGGAMTARGHRYAGADFTRDEGRHFGAPSIPKPVATTDAPLKTSAEIQAEAAAAKVAAMQRTGRRATVLTTGREASAPTMAGSIITPGGSSRLGAGA